MAYTYGTAVQIKAWTNPATAPNKLYDVIPYRAGSAVTGDQLLDAEADAAETHFQLLKDNSTINPLLYDQIEMTEKVITVPSGP